MDHCCFVIHLGPLFLFLCNQDSGDTSFCHEMYIDYIKIPIPNPLQSTPIFHNFYKLLEELLAS